MGWLPLAVSAAGSVSVDATGTASPQFGSNPFFDYTGMTVGSGNALLACIQPDHAGVTINSAVWDQGGTNQSMTLIGRLSLPSGSRTLEFWGLLAPTSGNKTMRITYSSNSAADIVSTISFNGVNQSSIANAFKNFGSTQTNTVSSIAVTISSGATHYVVAMSTDDLGVPNATGLTGTSLYLNNSGAVGLEGSYDVGSASKTMTATYSGNGNLGIIGVDVSP